MLKYIDCKCKQAGIAFAGDIKVKTCYGLKFLEEVICRINSANSDLFLHSKYVGSKIFLSKKK